MTEGTAPSAAASHDILYADSTAHCIKQSLNNGSFACIGAGGTTTNALTAAASGGAAAGTTFDGSVARTFDYHSFSAQCALTLTTTGSSGAATLGACSGGAATINIPQYSGGGGGYTNVTGSASETTVAQINAAGTVTGTYYATTPLSIATGGTITVPVQFSKAGLWTIASGQTVTFSQITTETDGPHQHFAGAGTVALASQDAPVEWWGAVGYTSQASAVSGTDSTTPIQACITAISGQCLLQSLFYQTTSALTVSASNKGIGGANVGATGYGGTDAPSVLITTSASADVIDAAGSVSVFIYGNEFTRFQIRRSQTPTGTAKGLSMQYMAGYRVDGVVSMDSIYGFYLSKRLPAWTTGYIENSAAMWGYNSVTSTGSIYGFYFDASASDFASIVLRNNIVSNSGPQGTTSYNYYFSGTGITDIRGDQNEGAGSNYGLYLTGNAQDFHWNNFVFDGCLTTCIYVSSAGTTAEFSGGWINAVSSATYGIQIISSTGVAFHNVSLLNSSTNSGVNIDGSRDIVFSGSTLSLNSSVTGFRVNNTVTSTISANSINIFNSSTGIAVSGGSVGVTLTGNSIRGNGTDTGISFAGSSTNATAGNTISFSSGSNTGISYDATSNNNPYAQSNSFNSAVTTPISDAGTGNQLPGGTTTNALTANSSGGAAAGTTFDGSVARTFDYHSFGALAAASGVFTGTPDASGATQFKLPVAASGASLANGELIYDSTNKNWHGWVNGADTIFAPLASGFTTGHCGQPTLHTNTWQIDDAGGACGVSGGGASFSATTSGTNTTASMVLGSGSSLDVSGTGTNNATKIGGITITGTPSTGYVPTATSSSAATWQALGGYPAAETHTASSSASLIFTSCISSSYSAYEIRVTSLIPGTASTNLLMQMSTNGGSTYDTSTTVNWWKHINTLGAGGGDDFGSGTNGYQLDGTGALTTGTAEPLSGTYRLYDPLSTTANKEMMGQFLWKTGSAIIGSTIYFRYTNTNAVNAFRIIMSSGNIASGTVTCQPLPQ